MVEEFQGKPVVGEVVALTDEEKKFVEEKRKLKEKQSACTKELQAVLEKYGFELKIASNPQIVLVPKVI